MVCLLRFVLYLCLSAVPLQAQEQHSAATDLGPTSQQASTAELIIQIVADAHYKKAPLDDQLSEKILASYLHALDPYKDIFLQKDIVRFDRFRHGLDDALREGRLEPVFEIFVRYRARLNERAAYTDSLLAKGLDFEADERHRSEHEAQAWIANKTALDEHWRKRLTQETIALRLTFEQPADVLATLRNRYEKLKTGTARLQGNDVFRIFINAYLSTIEPHTSYHLPRKPRSAETGHGSALEGIGVQLKSMHEHVVIKRVFAGGSADRSGQIHAGDRIIALAEGSDGDFVNVVAWPLADVVELIRGPKGTKVRLRIAPKGAGSRTASVVVSVTRDRIVLQERMARKALLQIPGIQRRYGVIEIPRFHIDYAGFGRTAQHYRSTSMHVEGLLKKLREDGVDGIVIDLRGNSGGALLAAVRMAGLFIESGPVVQIKHASGDIEVFRDTDARTVYAGPLAVLMDRYSASASEIFAAAIQDHRRGIIIGERSYGKGTVQETFDLNSFSKDARATFGQLITTVAQYFRITGKSTQIHSVTPDVEMVTAYNPGEYGERLEKNALPWEQMQAMEFEPNGQTSGVTAETRRRHAERMKNETAFRIFSQIHASRLDDDPRKDVTLSEQERRFQQSELRRRVLENELRSVFGLSPLAIHESSDGKHEIRWNRAILEEAAKILDDASYGR